MSATIVGGTSGVVADVDAATKALIVQLPRALSNVGFTAMASTPDTGSVTGSPLTRAVSALSSGRLEASAPVPLFSDLFTYGAQDTGRWSLSLSTQTAAWAGGGGVLTLNSGLSTAINTYAVFKSYWQHSLPTDGALIFKTRAGQTAAAQANAFTEFGFLFAATNAAATDGVFFRFDATGVLRGVLNNAGVEYTTGILTAPTPGNLVEWQIVVDRAHVEFWISGVLQASIATPAGYTCPLKTPQVQLLYRTCVTGTAPAIGNSLKIGSVSVWSTDDNDNRPSAYYRAAQGLMGYQALSGATIGSTARHTNNTNPTAAVPTNTTAALGTGLGGEFWETATLAVNTDGIIASYQTPTGSLTNPAKKLVITGVRWQSTVQTVLAGGPFLYQAFVLFGHTAVSLATGEAVTSKSPRAVPLGQFFYAAAAAVGTSGGVVQLTFASPIVVNPGEFVAFAVKNIGTVGTSGTIAHSITVDAHWD